MWIFDILWIFSTFLFATVLLYLIFLGLLDFLLLWTSYGIPEPVFLSIYCRILIIITVALYGLLRLLIMIIYYYEISIIILALEWTSYIIQPWTYIWDNLLAAWHFEYYGPLAIVCSLWNLIGFLWIFYSLFVHPRVFLCCRLDLFLRGPTYCSIIYFQASNQSGTFFTRSSSKSILIQKIKKNKKLFKHHFKQSK